MMHKLVSDLLLRWAGLLVKNDRLAIWSVIPSCLMWIVKRERNSHIFKNKDSSVPQLKSQLKENLLALNQAFSPSPTEVLICCLS